MQPMLGPQESIVQRLLSVQFFGVAMQPTRGSQEALQEKMN